jgi:hypothetical protein
MARIRSIKPDFFASEDVSRLPLRARLTWVGLWTNADDHGRAKDVLGLLKAAIWPLDDDISLDDIEEDLCELADQHRIVRYEVDGRHYIAIVNWHLHQAINRPKASDLPPPPVAVGPTDPQAPKGYCADCAKGVLAPIQDAALPTQAPVTDGAVTAQGPITPGREGKGREWRGSARVDSDDSRPTTSRQPETPEPPQRSPQHLGVKRPPRCGACGDARREHDAWTARIRAKPTPTPGTPECPLHPGQPTGSKACPECARDAQPAPDLRALRGAS